MYSKAKGFLLWLFGWEEPIQSPEQIIDAKTNELTVYLNRCKVHVAKLIKEQRDLQEKIHRNTNQITHHLREARNCLARSEQERTKEHLRQKMKHEQIGDGLKKSLGKFKGESEKLVDNVRKLEFKLEELKRHKMLLLTQRQCYEAQLLLEGKDNEDGPAGVKELLAGLEEEVLEKQTRVLLEGDLDSSGVSESTPDLGDDRLNAALEEEMAQLRNRLTAVNPDEEPNGPDSQGSQDDIIFIK